MKTVSKHKLKMSQKQARELTQIEQLLVQYKRFNTSANKRIVSFLESVASESCNLLTNVGGQLRRIFRTSCIHITQLSLSTAFLLLHK